MYLNVRDFYICKFYICNYSAVYFLPVKPKNTNILLDDMPVLSRFILKEGKSHLHYVKLTKDVFETPRLT